MGCHAGYNVAGLVVPASLDADWPQTFAAQQAVYVANTTYGLGDTAAVAYSEQVMANFAHYLNGTMTVGEAYANAISDYFGGLGTVSPYDEKAGEAATLFGLPMYRFQTAKAAPAPPPVVQTQPDAITGLTSASLTSTPGFVFHHTTTGDYYTDGANQPQTTLYQPLEPRSAPVDVTQPGGSPRTACGSTRSSSCARPRASRRTTTGRRSTSVRTSRRSCRRTRRSPTTCRR